MAEKISAVEFARKFREFFPDLGDHRKFYDTAMISITGSPAIDVIALDKAIGVPDGISTAEEITRRYGAPAANWVRSMI